MSSFPTLSLRDISLVLGSLYILSRAGKWLLRLRPGYLHPTRLKGPPRKSFFQFGGGYQREYIKSQDGSVMYEEWEAEHGPCFEVPWTPTQTRIVLTDPKAVAHFYARETFTYVQTKIGRQFIGAIFGKGILYAEGEDHKRQRKALTPAFSNAAIRRITSVFYDSAYKLQTILDDQLEASSEDGMVVDVQKWMNRVAIDSIGIAGFSHEFRTLDGTYPPVEQAFDQGGGAPLVNPLMFVLAPFIPFLVKIMLREDSPGMRLRRSLEKVADDLLEKSRVGGSEKDIDNSIIGLLLKAESTDKELFMTQDEVVAQNVLLLAGYMTTSISLTWALIELSRNPEQQTKLRNELTEFYHRTGGDPTYEQLQSATALPFLDAVVHEVLRLHPPLVETNRVAQEDDVIPVLYPLTTKDGQVVDHIVVKKGQGVSVPIRLLGRSTVFWGEDAKEFKPQRWLDMQEEKNSLKAKELSGYRHLLTFSDGPRTCLGKAFALAEFKSVISVLIRNYTYEFPNGVDTTIVKHPGILARPKVEGFEKAEVPLRIRRVVA